MRIKPKAVAGLAQMQLQLLEKAARMAGAGSKICYSTCSILRQENSEVAKKFLSKSPDFSLESQELVLPSSAGDTCDHDGGYIAIVRKKLT